MKDKSNKEDKCHNSTDNYGDNGKNSSDNAIDSKFSADIL